MNKTNDRVDFAVRAYVETEEIGSSFRNTYASAMARAEARYAGLPDYLKAEVLVRIKRMNERWREPVRPVHAPTDPRCAHCGNELGDYGLEECHEFSIPLTNGTVLYNCDDECRDSTMDRISS